MGVAAPLARRQQPREPGYATRGMLSASAKEEAMAYRIAGIDVHKKKLAVVLADVETEDEYQFERRSGANHYVPAKPDSYSPNSVFDGE